MGIPGAGKSRVAEEYVARGYVRLNRDERGGTLRDIAAALDEQLSSGVRHVVLDNTYLTRASRSYAIEAAARHGVAARCIWLDTPLAQAQVNLVERLLERFGSLRRLPRSFDARATRAGPARADVADASAPRARAAGRRRGLRQTSSTSRSNVSQATREPAASSSRQLPSSTRRPRAHRTSSSTGGPAATGCARRRRQPACGQGLGARGRRALPASRRPADLLVPAAAAGAAARVRAGARRRPGPLDAHRHEPCQSDAGDHARRPLRLRLIPDAPSGAVRGRPRRPPPSLAWLFLCRYFLRFEPCHLVAAFASLFALSVPLTAEPVIANVSVA